MAGPTQKGHAMAALVLGIVECVCGLIIIILSGVLAGKANIPASVSPYWAGIVVAIPGIVGVVAGITKNHGAMIGVLVLNIIALIIEGVGALLIGLITAVWKVAADASDNCSKSGYQKCSCSSGSTNFTLDGIDDCDIISTMYGLALGILIMLIIGVITALAVSIIGCMSVCCTKGNQGQPGTVVIQQGNVPMQQQYNQPPPTKY